MTTTLRLVPCTWAMAQDFNREWHRHLRRPPAGHRWCHGLALGDELVGVAIVGNPLAREYNRDGLCVEVNRCTVADGIPNGCSMLYGAAARAAFALGFRRVITYTETLTETGASLRAAGWRVVAERPARGGWDMPSRPRRNPQRDGIPRTLWETS